jgi:hypothetical protein
MKVGLGQMSRIICLGEKAKVREPESLDHLSLLPNQIHIRFPLDGGVSEHEKKEEDIDGKI